MPESPESSWGASDEHLCGVGGCGWGGHGVGGWTVRGVGWGEGGKSMGVEWLEAVGGGLGWWGGWGAGGGGGGWGEEVEGGGERTMPRQREHGMRNACGLSRAPRCR